jgi:RecJ-like exonuclease
VSKRDLIIALDKCLVGYDNSDMIDVPRELINQTIRALAQDAQECVCPQCRGIGEFASETCDVCDGSGWVEVRPLPTRDRVST